MVIANPLLERHRAGRPLFTINVTASELTSLRTLLSEAITKAGIEALRKPDLASLFVVYSAEVLCQESRTLHWRPILLSLGVELHDSARYVVLYDSVEEALRNFGRQMIIRPNGRRFLATLLREGGLPVHIGNLPELIQSLGRDVGWEALSGPEGTAVRRFAVQRIRALAHKTLRKILDVEEALEALEDVLADAASTRERLTRCGVNPTTLASHDAVKEALLAHGIELPAARNEKLLAAILASFRETTRVLQREPTASQGGPLQLRARIIEERRIELRASLDLSHTALRAGIPDVTFATIAVEPGGAQRLIQWDEDTKTFGSDQAVAGRLEWRINTVGDQALTLVARSAVRGGAPTVVPVTTIEMPEQAIWWFDGEGVLLRAEEMVLASGQRRCLVAPHEKVSIAISGNVVARELSCGECSAWFLKATGEGSARVLNNRGEELGLIECRKRLLAVSSTGSLPSRFSRATHAVERLPDLIAEDASVVVDLEVSVGAGGSFQRVARGSKGIFRLSALPQLRNSFGVVRARLTTLDGRAFLARWTVIPPQVVELIGAQRVIFNDKRILHVNSVPNTVSYLGSGRFQIDIPPGTQDVGAELHLNSGDLVRVRVRLPKRWTRLWRDILTGDEAPLDGSAVLTEGMVFGHACFEARSDSDREVWLEDEGGTRLITSRTDHFGRALIPLREVLRHKLRLGDSTILVTARVEGDPALYRFKVLVPRMARPTALKRQGELVLQLLLDERDLPAVPKLACFDVLSPFDTPAIVPCTLAPAGPQRFEVTVPADKLPSSRGRWIVMLVDAALEPVRSHSGALLVEIPLGLPAVPPRMLSPLEDGLWNKDKSKILDALEASAIDLPVFALWLDRFVAAVRTRAGFGLGWFLLFELVAERAPWILLAAALNLSPRERFAWFDVYRAELRGFSWLGFDRSARRTFGRVLRRTKVEDIVALVETAKQALPMPRAIELAVYREALFGRPEGAPLIAQLEEEMYGRGGPLVLPRDWQERLALPMRDLHEAAKEDGLRGRRAAALINLRWGTNLALLQGLPDARQFQQWETTQAEALLWIETEARDKGVSVDGHARVVVDAERRVVDAAHMLTQYREHGARLGKSTWIALRQIERSVPDLLDTWLLAFAGKD